MHYRRATDGVSGRGTLVVMTIADLDGDIGRVLGGRYRIIAPIGAGASARVFLADDVTLRRRVAVKVLHDALADDDAFLRRFRAEAHAAASLNHPHVLGVYDWGHDEVPFLVTEYLAGGSLRAILSSGTLLTPSQGLLVGLEAGRGLDYAHGQGLVHRDIKPANLLFGEGARLRIADFGLARALAEAGWTEPDGSLVGTVRYAAPEQARGEKVGPAADVYALALVINEAISGEVPFASDTAVATLMARADTPFEPHIDTGPMQGALRRAGALDPADRPSASDFVSMLMQSASELSRPDPIPLVGALGPSAAEAANHATRFGETIAPSAAGSEAVEGGSPKALKRSKSSVAGSGRKRRRWLWVILASITVAAAAAGGVAAWSAAQPVNHDIPAFAGSDSNTVITRIAELGWVTKSVDVRQNGTTDGEVVGTDPEAGTTLEEGETITVYVSLGPELAIVPELAGAALSDAQAQLTEAGLKPGAVTRIDSETVPADSVIEVRLAAGVTELEPGMPVDLVVSKGPKKRFVPDIPASGGIDEASTALLAEGLNPVESHDNSESVPAGQVIGFSPTVGAQVERGTDVTVIISDGPAPREIPNVIGLDVTEATKVLQDAGFVVNGVQGNLAKPVLATDPPAGEVHAYGTEVVIATELKP